MAERSNPPSPPRSAQAPEPSGAEMSTPSVAQTPTPTPTPVPPAAPVPTPASPIGDPSPSEITLTVTLDVALALEQVIESLRTDRRFFQRLLGAAGSLQSSPRQGPLTDLVRALAGQQATILERPAMQRLQDVADGTA
jgi:hypothetical protein